VSVEKPVAAVGMFADRGELVCAATGSASDELQSVCGVADDDSHDHPIGGIGSGRAGSGLQLCHSRIDNEHGNHAQTGVWDGNRLCNGYNGAYSSVEHARLQHRIADDARGRGWTITRGSSGECALRSE